MSKSSQKPVYSIIALADDGFGVRVSLPGQGTSTVTEFRSLEEAEAWIVLQQQKNESDPFPI